ncbi:MAG: iron-containing alcohol dehydrogenase [Treponema sp.]|jgi:alcohol dehydrogenase class IV|nr:iron-containing alcohol dehydrogenase [Treponema sp.]
MILLQNVFGASYIPMPKGIKTLSIQAVSCVLVLLKVKITMVKINYVMPTRVVMGNGCLWENRNFLKELGKKALIVTGKGSAKTNGSYNDLVKALEANGQTYTLYDQVMSNPTVDCVFEGAAKAKKDGCDCVVAIGGGSPMDAGKVIAGIAVQEVQKREIFTASFTKALPIGAIPTTAGTGSEVTPYAILTNHEAQTKTSIAGTVFFPRFAFLDPVYMQHLSKPITVGTALDALSHAIEGMLSVRASPLSDALAKESISGIADCFPFLEQEKLELQVRQKLLWASTLGGMVIANTGTTGVHAMGYMLTYFKNIDHGRANGLLLGHYLKVLETKDPTNRVKTILRCLKVETLEDFVMILNRLLGPCEKYDASELEAYAARAVKAKNIANCIIKLEKDELLDIFKRSVG